MANEKKSGPAHEQLLTAEDVAWMLRIPPDELPRIKSLRALAIDLSGRRAEKGSHSTFWRFLRADVEAWLKGLRPQAVAA